MGSIPFLSYVRLKVLVRCHYSRSPEYDSNVFKLWKYRKKTISVRIHDCPQCGFVADRDYNAAVNIHRVGMGQPFKPVEILPLHHISVMQVVSMKQEAPPFRAVVHISGTYVMHTHVMYSSSLKYHLAKFLHYHSWCRSRQCDISSTHINNFIFWHTNSILMKLIIAGSRDFDDMGFVAAWIIHKFRLDDIDEIVSGGARVSMHVANSLPRYMVFQSNGSLRNGICMGVLRGRSGTRRWRSMVTY